MSLLLGDKDVVGEYHKNWLQFVVGRERVEGQRGVG
jgi:hypothetical protein